MPKTVLLVLVSVLAAMLGGCSGFEGNSDGQQPVVRSSQAPAAVGTFMPARPANATQE